MAKKKSGLGRGLGAFGLPEPLQNSKNDKKKVQPVSPSDEDVSIQEIDISKITVNPHQPRSEFDEDALKALQESIKQYGVLQPVLVRKTPKGFELIAGERRLRASKLAGQKVIPAVIKEYNDAQMTEIALIENIQRENLNPVEEAHAYHHLLTDYGLTQDMLSKKVGRSRSHIANFLRLLKLAPGVQKKLINNELSMGQAKPLLIIEEDSLQEKAAEFIISNDLSVRKVEALVKQIVKHPDFFEEKESDPKGHDTDPATLYLLEAEDKLKMFFGTAVRIKGSGKRKKLEIELSSQEELERILTLIADKVTMQDNATKLAKLREYSTKGKFSV
ncbi:MAG: ParB/RepB/Spo0J family partition protein [Anaerovibrio sp.]|uniref:ParB/RepB/Spo0J family partition protein n=1 Tax=Anaerovibrio sp. TaxID=1872532 RepID=UPI0025D7D7BC|nr:ParB/RepB/Spo0J family partition protein [Anaerovibrio sp.]MCR5177132.1 ParB/RepB/Spo0J family partition protein [Anaerovibrio sp.]